MSYASFLADKIATRDRGEFLAEYYIKSPLGVETILRFSYRGTATGASAITIGSDTIAAHTPFRKRLIIVPTITQSLWQEGKILSSSLPSFGESKLSNYDGGLDQYHPNLGWQWSGCRCKIFFCDYTDIANTIGKIFDGYIGPVEFSLPEVTIPLKGREDLFSVPTSNRVYRGTGYMLELSGVRTVSYGTPAAVDLTGNMTLEGWTWVDTTPGVNVAPVWGWTNSGWRLNLTTSRQFSFRQAVAGVTQGPTQTTGIPAQTFCHIAVVISGTTLTFYTYNDDTQVTTTEVVTNAFTSATRDIHSAGVYEHNSASTLVQWWDECRVWNYARTLTEIEADRFREMTSIPATLVHYVRFNDGTGTTVTDSSATAAHGTISGAGTSTWLHSQEGGPELAGTPKLDVWGERWGIAPTVVDPIRQGYQVAGGGPINDLTSYEGGAAHTSTSAASFRAYLTTTPAAGQQLKYLARGLFKLGSIPILPVSAFVKGYNGGSLGYVNTGATITRDIITRRGPKLTDPTDLDTASFTSYASANTGILGRVLYQPETIGAFLDSIMKSGAGFWGYIGSSTLFYIEKYAGASVTANYNFTQRNTIAVSPLPPVAVVYRVVVRYRRNDVVLAEDKVSASVKGTANWTQWTQEWQEQPREDLTIRAAYPGSGSIELVFETDLQYQTDAGLLADYLLALLKGEKIGYASTVTSDGFAATISQTMTQSITLQQGSTTRLGLDGTRKFSILTVTINYQDGSVRLDHWG